MNTINGSINHSLSFDINFIMFKKLALNFNKMINSLRQLFVLFYLSLVIPSFAQDNYILAIDYQFDDAGGFASNGLAPVRRGDYITGKCGYIDQTGKLVIDYQFDDAGGFASNGLAPVRRGDYITGKWGYIDQTGKLVINYQFDGASDFAPNGLAYVRRGDDKTGKYGYIDQTGKLVIDYQFDAAGNFASNGLAPVRKGDDKTGKWGYIDQTGKLAIDYQFDWAWVFAPNGLACVRRGDDKTEKYGYVDLTGKLVIDYQFDWAWYFAPNGLAPVRRGDYKAGKCGYIDQTGKLVIDYQFDWAGEFAPNGLAPVRNGDYKAGKYGFIKIITLTDRVEEFVKDEITKWQQKGKYETTEAYTSRVTEANRKKKIEDLSAIAMQNIAPTYCEWETISTEYDADNQIYKVSVKGLSPFFVKVPLAEAESFDVAIRRLHFTNKQYALGANNIFFLQRATIINPDNNKTYTVSSTDQTVFAYSKLNMNFEPIQLNIQNTDNAQNVKTETKYLTVGLSDVDTNIPKTLQSNDKTFVVIIANENYAREVKVQFAANDGKVFREYCEKTLGIPPKNIHFSQDATFGTMKSEIKWISDVTQAYNGQVKLIFYYAGHGMPNEADKSAYLLPVDGFSSDFETAIKLEDLYKRLTFNPSQGVTVLLDACFSGSVRDNGMLANARSVKIKPRTDILNGKMVVFSAATGDETAYPYKEKQHGLFTYFLLKKLQETKGNVDYQTLSNYIIENVRQQSIVVNQKSQTPQVNPSIEIQNTWQQMKIN